MIFIAHPLDKIEVLTFNLEMAYKKTPLSREIVFSTIEKSVIPFLIMTAIVVATSFFILKSTSENAIPKYEIIQQRVYIIAAFLIFSALVASLTFTYLTAKQRETSKILYKSEIQFKQLIETMDEGIIIADNKGIIIFVNPRLYEITGYKSQELVGKKFVELTAIKDRYKFLYKWKKQIESGNVQPAEVTVYRKTGEKLTLLITPSLLKDNKNNFLSFIALVRDITEEKKLKKRLYEESQFFQVNPSVQLRTDTKGIINLCNKAALSFFGNDIKGKNIQHFVDVPIEENIKNISPGEFFQFEVTQRNISIMFTTTKNESGEFLYFYGSDITSLKEANKEILKFLQAVEQSDSVIIITDPDERIIFVNRAMENYAGYKPEEIIGKTPRIFQSGLVSDKTYKELKETIYRGKTWEGEFINKKKNGKLFWEHAIITPVIDNNGKIISFVAVKNDITKQKELEAQQQKIIEETDKANRLKSIFLANMSHEIRTPMNAIIGYTDILLAEEENPEKKQYLKTIKQSSHTLLNLINDILDFSKIEADKMELNEEPFSVVKIVDHMKSMFNHQIKEKNLEFIVEIKENVPPVLYGDANRIGQIIINFLSNAKKFTEKGSISLSVEYENGKLKISVKDTGIGISPENQDKIFSPFVQADASHSRPIAGTGLGLAISKKLAKLMGGDIYVDSTPGKGSTFTLEIPLKTLSQKDSKPRDRSNQEIFLVQSDITQTGEKMVEGWLNNFNDIPELKEILLMGVKKLPKMLKDLETAVSSAHIGNIQFIAHELKGMSGNLKLKQIYTLANAINEEANKAQPNMSKINDLVFNLKNVIENIPSQYIRQKETELYVKEDTTADFNILLAEDNPINRKLIETILNKIKLTCDIAKNGEEALIKLLNNKYDLVLMDIQMPKLDGPQVLTEIKKRQELKNTYIIALTANAIKGDREKYLAMGFDEYISKPIDIKEFTGKILSLLSKKAPVKSTKESNTDKIDSETKQKLKLIIKRLEENKKIFNPQFILKISEELKQLKPSIEIQEISILLASSAGSFDEEAVDIALKRLHALI